MRVDLPARSTPYTTQQMLDAVDTLHPAIEIPDSRFSDFVGAGEAQLIADNALLRICSCLGPATTSDWRSLDLVEQKTGRHDGAASNSSGHGKNVLGDPAHCPHMARPTNCASSA